MNFSILFLAAVLEACLGNPLHIHQAYSQYEYSLKYGSYYKIQPPPDYLNPFYKGDLELLQTCPDSPPCTSKLNPDKTGPYRCVIDQNCPESFKCCPHSCFNHKVCLYSTARIIPSVSGMPSNNDVATVTDVTDDERSSIASASVSASASASASASTRTSEESVREKTLPDYSKKLPIYPGSISYTRSEGSFSTDSSNDGVDHISTPASQRRKSSGLPTRNYSDDDDEASTSKNIEEETTTITEDVKSWTTLDESNSNSTPRRSSESTNLNPSSDSFYDEKKSKGDEPTEVPTFVTDADILNETEIAPSRHVTRKTDDSNKENDDDRVTNDQETSETSIFSGLSFSNPTTESFNSGSSPATSRDVTLITDDDFSGSGDDDDIYGDDEDY